MNSQRLYRCTVLLQFLFGVREAVCAETPWPLWNGAESTADYASRIGLQPEVSLRCANGVNLKAVLIPAGKFKMGSSEPRRPKRTVMFGGMIFTGGLTAIISIAAIVVWRSIAKRRRPQFSLLGCLGITLALAFMVIGKQNSEKAAQEWVDYRIVRKRPIIRDEQPAHDVLISKPFYIGRFEVTQEEFEALVSNNHRYSRGTDLPVQGVTWDEARAFCAALTRMSKRVVRLPTEAEWEYACRAGSESKFCCGDSDSKLSDYGWHAANSSAINPIGQKKPNKFDVYDMHGNAIEWCQDWYGPYSNQMEIDPTGPDDGTYRVLRGGSCGYRAMLCRSASRIENRPENRVNQPGFRVVVELPAGAKY